jgi:uncharacterized protein
VKRVVTIVCAALGLLVVLVAAGAYYATEHILPYSSIRPHRVTKAEIQKRFNGVATPSAAGLTWQPFDIVVEDTIPLRGWFVNARSTPAQGTIFLLHGIASCKEAMITTSEMFSSEGFNCVLYDSRANGQSGGINCTFGYYEKRDLSRYLDSTIARFPGSGPYGIFGNSLGAAVAIQALAEDRRLVCGVAESPFASLRDVIHDYFARLFHIRLNAIPDRALRFSEKIAHFSVDSVQPAQSATKIVQPVMVIHGMEDDHISAAYGKQVYDNLLSADKVWMPIAGGDHYNLKKVGGAQFRESIIGFFRNHMRVIDTEGWSGNTRVLQ